MIVSDLHSTPVETPSDDTSGEDTERNYRYQHAYGVILLVGIVSITGVNTLSQLACL